MKKTYSAPVMEVEKFDFVDVITLSAASISQVSGGGTGVSGQTYEVQVQSKW